MVPTEGNPRMIGVSMADWREQALQLLQGTGGDHATAARELSLDEIQSAVKTFRSKHWQLSPQKAFDFLNLVFPDRHREETLFGIFLLTVFKEQLPENTWAALEGWLERVDHWLICDQLAINIAGRMLTENHRRWPTVESWIRSENPWLRRFAVMTAGVAMKKDGCKPRDLLKLVDPLMKDPSSHVQNVAAWAVRQVAKLDEDLAVSFLKKWKGRCQHEIYRESCTHLSPQARMVLLKAKSHST